METDAEIAEQLGEFLDSMAERYGLESSSDVRTLIDRLKEL